MQTCVAIYNNERKDAESSFVTTNIEPSSTMKTKLIKTISKLNLIYIDSHLYILITQFQQVVIRVVNKHGKYIYTSIYRYTYLYAYIYRILLSTLVMSSV